MSKTARRHALAEAQNWRCAHCGGVMLCEPGHQDTATIEHVVPLGQGGRKFWGNEVSAHARCNFARGTKKLDAESMSIARELMEKERAAEAAIAVRRAEEMLAEVDGQLRDIRKLLLGALPAPAAVALLRMVNAMISGGSAPAPLQSAPPPPSWIRTLGLRLMCHADRVRARSQMIVQAVVTAWRAPIAALGTPPRVESSGPPVQADPKADWKLLYAPAWADHMGMRPKGYSRDSWRARFFQSTPTALTHPGCPTEYMPKAVLVQAATMVKTKLDGQTREDGYDQA